MRRQSTDSAWGEGFAIGLCLGTILTLFALGHLMAAG